MADSDKLDSQKLALAQRRTTMLVVVASCGLPLVTAAIALSLASGMLAEPGFATAVAVTALLLLLG